MANCKRLPEATPAMFHHRSEHHQARPLGTSGWRPAAFWPFREMIFQWKIVVEKKKKTWNPPSSQPTTKIMSWDCGCQPKKDWYNRC